MKYFFLFFLSLSSFGNDKVLDLLDELSSSKYKVSGKCNKNNGSFRFIGSGGLHPTIMLEIWGDQAKWGKIEDSSWNSHKGSFLLVKEESFLIDKICNKIFETRNPKN